MKIELKEKSEKQINLEKVKKEKSAQLKQI